MRIDIRPRQKDRVRKVVTRDAARQHATDGVSVAVERLCRVVEEVACAGLRIRQDVLRVVYCVEWEGTDEVAEGTDGCVAELLVFPQSSRRRSQVFSSISSRATEEQDVALVGNDCGDDCGQ